MNKNIANNPTKIALVEALLKEFNGAAVSRTQILDYCAKNKMEKPRWIFHDKYIRVGRGMYDLSKLLETVPVKTAVEGMTAPA